MMTGWRVRAAYGAIVGLSMAALVACAQGDEESRGPLGEGRGVVTDDDANRLWRRHRWRRQSGWRW